MSGFVPPYPSRAFMAWTKKVTILTCTKLKVTPSQILTVGITSCRDQHNAVGDCSGLS